MTIQEEQLTLIIRRSPNIGLGISIAGGIGSTPYKDNDYVRDGLFSFLLSFSFILGSFFNKNQ
jgi:hypothetical protein